MCRIIKENKEITNSVYAEFKVKIMVLEQQATLLINDTLTDLKQNYFHTNVIKGRQTESIKSKQ